MPIPSDLKSVFWSQARRPVNSRVGPDLGVDYEQRDREPNQCPHRNADEDEARATDVIDVPLRTLPQGANPEIERDEQRAANDQQKRPKGYHPALPTKDRPRRSL